MAAYSGATISPDTKASISTYTACSSCCTALLGAPGAGGAPSITLQVVFVVSAGVVISEGEPAMLFPISGAF